jgi:hypothetical protein
LALAILIALAAASAPADGARALWIGSGLERAEADALRSACSRALELSLLDAGDAAAELERTASASVAVSGSELEAELAGARRAFVELKLQRATAGFTRALRLALEDERDVPAPSLIARILFERSITFVAMRKNGEARRDLAAAIAIDPALDPSPDEYGPPVIRSVDGARKSLRRAKKLRLSIARAPADAIVEVDGRAVEGEEPIELSGIGPHLITAERAGHRPYAELIELLPRGETRRAIVLAPASGALLAWQTLETWRAHGSSALDRLALDVARLLGIERVLVASREGDGVALRLVEASSGRVQRAVRGGLIEWEPHPYAALAASLAGTTLAPPELTLTVSAPTAVAPGEAVPLAIAVVDPAHRLRKIRAECGELRAESAVGARSRSFVETIAIRAPETEGPLACSVLGLDEAARIVVRAPSEGEPLAVLVREPEDDGDTEWYVLGGIGAAVIAAVAAGAVLSRDPPPAKEVFIVHGPE